MYKKYSKVLLLSVLSLFWVACNPDSNLVGNPTPNVPLTPTEVTVSFVISASSFKPGTNVSKSDVTVDYNGSLSSSDLVAPAVIEGHEFNGWYKENTFTTQVTYSTVFSEDSVLYAKYTPKSYRINYIDETGILTSKNISYPENHTYGTDTRLPSVEGCHWYLEGNGYEIDTLGAFSFKDDSELTILIIEHENLDCNVGEIIWQGRCIFDDGSYF